MTSNLESDPRRRQALVHMCEARLLLENAQANHLDHSERAIVQAAHKRISIVLRFLSGTRAPNAEVLATRLRAVAMSVLECSALEARMAYFDIEAAAVIFLSTAETEQTDHA